MNLKNLGYFFSAIVLSACATSYKPAVQKKIENERVFNVSFDKAWAKMVDFVSSNGMNIKTIDKASGLMTFERAYDHEFNDNNLDCGSRSSPNSAPITNSKDEKKSGKSSDLNEAGGLITLNFFVEKMNNKETKVKINLFGRISLHGGLINGMEHTGIKDFPCFSNGHFEEQVFAAIQQNN